MIIQFLLQIRRHKTSSLGIFREKVCCDPSLEPSHRDGSNEVSQHTVSLRNKKNITEFSSNCLKHWWYFLTFYPRCSCLPSYSHWSLRTLVEMKMTMMKKNVKLPGKTNSCTNLMRVGRLLPYIFQSLGHPNYLNCLKDVTVWCCNAVTCLKDPYGMANCVDPDQTAPFRSSVIRVCTVCSDLSVPIHWIFMVNFLITLLLGWLAMMDDLWFLHPFQQYFSHIRTMAEW